MPRDVVSCRTLQATLWDSDKFQENTFLGCVTINLDNIDLSKPSEQWYKLTNLQRINTRYTA